jgi:hypothetical protein
MATLKAFASDFIAQANRDLEAFARQSEQLARLGSLSFGLPLDSWPQIEKYGRCAFDDHVALQANQDLEAFTRVSAELANAIRKQHELPDLRAHVAEAEKYAAELPQLLAKRDAEIQKKIHKEMMAATTPLPELLAAERKQLVADLLAAQRKNSGGGRPREFDHDAVRAFAGPNPSLSRKRQTRRKFKLSQHQLNRILEGGHN